MRKPNTMDDLERQKLVKILKELQLDTMAVESVDKGDYDSDVEYLTAKLHWAEVQIEALIIAKLQKVDRVARESELEFMLTIVGGKFEVRQRIRDRLNSLKGGDV